MDKAILLGNLSITGFLTGLIWFVQIVHYPSFGKVPAEGFVKFHHFHTAATGSVVALPMLIELFLAFALLSVGFPKWGWLTWVALALVLLVWLQTFFQFMPLHGKLSTGANAELVNKLVSANGWRTLAWTSRLIVLMILFWVKF